MMRMLVLALALAASAAHATQDAIPGLYRVHDVAPDDVLYVRARPDARARIIGEFAPDDRKIEVVAMSDDLRWGQVNVEEGAGWVALRYLITEPGGFQGRFPSPAACFGTEPFWTVDIDDGGMGFDRLDGPQIEFPGAEWQGAMGRSDQWSARAFLDGRAMSVVIRTGACSDGMSDRAFGLTANVLISTDAGHEHYTGCCSLSVD